MSQYNPTSSFLTTLRAAYWAEQMRSLILIKAVLLQIMNQCYEKYNNNNNRSANYSTSMPHIYRADNHIESQPDAVFVHYVDLALTTFIHTLSITH